MTERTAVYHRAGEPCPNGCTVDFLRREPERLTANIDGEVSCPTCWECFGIPAEQDRPPRKHRGSR